jgi:hypothetical protein
MLLELCLLVTLFCGCREQRDANATRTDDNVRAQDESSSGPHRDLTNESVLEGTIHAA